MNEKYYLNTKFTNDSVSRSEVEEGVLLQYRSNIDKLNEYYSNKSKRDSTRRVDSSSPLINNYDENKTPQTITLTQEMKDEVERDTRLKEDQERMYNYRQGTTLDPTNIELFKSNPKKKKKK